MDIKQIHSIEPFNEIFPVDNKTLQAIKEDMEAQGYDQADPIVVWKRWGRFVCVDGHTRLIAAKEMGIDEIPVIEKTFEDDNEAMDYAIHRQRDRRNMDDGELYRCAQYLDKRKQQGQRTDLASNDAKLKKGKSAEVTAKTLGTYTSKIERIRTIQDKAPEEVKEAVASGEMSINKAYEETRKKKDVEVKVRPTKEEKEQIISDKFKAAYEAFYNELINAKTLKWKTTSKQAAARCIGSLNSFINL